MPADFLPICRDYLEKNYFAKLGVRFSESIDELATGRQPVWRVVSADDLTSEVVEGGIDKAGLLLDPEIGLLFYIVPFATEMSMRKQIARALTLRSQLTIERNYSGTVPKDSDPRGAWRLVINWIVDEGKKENWIDQITEIRRETAFSEELSMDAIFLNGENLESELETHGFERLLLTTREVFRKQKINELVQWMSANQLVREAIRHFPSAFRKKEQHELADEIVRAMDDFHESAHVDTRQPPERPGTLRSIRVRNFRNLRDVTIDFGIQPVSTRVVHGPNGTGKSSLCEAISVALFRSSFRYKLFADRDREKDITATDRGADYLEHYLTPLDAENVEPKIAIDGGNFVSPVLVAADGVEEADLSMSGTILTQDMSLEFARMSSSELGARVLRGYSTLAEYIDQFTESRFSQANAERQTFLRTLGLPASITKVSTAYARLAKQLIDDSLPAFPVTLAAWLRRISRSTSANDLATRWSTWGGDEARSALAQEIAERNSDIRAITIELRRWLESFNELSMRTAEFSKIIADRLAVVQGDLDSAIAGLNAWGTWLERSAPTTAEATSSPGTASIAKRIEKSRAKQQQITETGRLASVHLDHLSRVKAFVEENWSKAHPNECPTCGADHSRAGGILKVIDSLLKQTRSERDRLRNSYTDIQNKISELEKSPEQLRRADCPVSDDDRSRFTAAFRWLIPDGADFANWIATRAQRDELLEIITVLRRIPALPASIAAENEAERVASIIESQFRVADKTFERPNNWKPVREKLTSILAEIVNEHLPNTIAKLWCELALNLTSAPWLLPARPCIDVVSRRGEQKSTIQVKGRLARYLFNQSEIHILGLAWFFTRYLMHSRFYHACIVMDDPAHELDQTSFRDLCRLWETIVRLHRVYNRQLKLVIMLNQESRAVEAARATSGILEILGWSREQDESVEATSIVGEGFFAPQPTMLFRGNQPQQAKSG